MLLMQEGDFSRRAEMNPGEWRVEFYQSGSINVEDGKRAQTKFGTRMVGPNISIHYRKPGLRYPGQEDVSDNERYVLAQDIANTLNGYDTALRTGLKRTGEESGESLLGIEFSANLQFIDQDPPNCLFTQNESTESKSARARLVDQIFGVQQPSECSDFL